MQRSFVLALVLGASCLAPARARRAVGDDLPTPSPAPVRAAMPAGPVDRGLPTPWAEPVAVSAGALAAPAPAASPERPAAAEDDDQGVPRLRPPDAGPSSNEPDPSTWDPRLPPLGHPIAARSRISLETDPEMHGTVETFPVDDATVALVMVGNPVIRGDDFVIKADTLVVWLDRTKNSAFLGFGAPPVGGAPSGAAAKDGKPGPPGPDGAAGSASTSVMPEAVIAIYAVGSVDLQSGDIAFRASELYVNDRRRRALLIEPRFDASTSIGESQKPIPIHVRAATMRTLADGYTAFEDAETTTARSNDRITLEIRVLTMEEYGQALAGKKPTLLGFKTAGSQRFGAHSIVGRAERLPLAYVPDAEFGGENGLADFPVRIRHLTAGSRSSFGRWGFLGVGSRQEVGDHAYVDWTANAVGYTKRGLGLGGELAWKVLGDPRSGPPTLAGKLETFGLYDLTGEDRSGYRAGEGFRGKFELENRWEATRSLRVDTELNAFTDRGFNREYFESDDKTHKDRETYARLRFMEGGTAATLTQGFHVRDFQTETIDQPTVGLWSESLPLGETSGPVHLAFDLSSQATLSRLARRFDTAQPDEDYGALRADVTERVYAPFDVGDVRVSPFVGVRVTGYFDRDDGGDDVTRTALEAGVRANLQLHRDYEALGGPWKLDGLRHVIDFDVGTYTRAFDDVTPADVPYFDRVDQEEDRNEVYVEMRQRLRDAPRDGRQVGRARAAQRDPRRPPGQGVLLAGRRRALRAPRPRASSRSGGWRRSCPGKAWLSGQSVASFEGATFQHSSIGVQYAPSDTFGAAVGVRHVKQEVLAPWFDVYGRWNEKWGARLSAIRDFDSSHGADFRLGMLRFSEDHDFGFGITVKDDGRDVGVFFAFHPAIGGEPLSSPFDPREAVDFTP